MMGIPNPGIIAGPRTSGIPYAVASITVVSGEVSADLTDFPVRVALADMPAAFWAAVASDGSDIQMFDSGANQIPRDLVAFDYGGETGDLFFKADLLTASDNVFFIAAGSGAAAPGNASTYGRDAVWTTYHRVMVFSGNSGADRTGNGGTFSLLGTATLASGVLNCRDGAGDTERAEMTCTYSASWVMGCRAYGSSVFNNQQYMDYGDGGTNYEGFGSRSSHDYFLYNPTDGLHTAAAGLNWWQSDHFIAESRNGTTNRKFWYDGAVATTDTTTVQYPPSSGATVLRMSFANGDGYKGYYDFSYLRHADPAADWMAAEYGSWFTPSNFYTVAAL